MRPSQQIPKACLVTPKLAECAVLGLAYSPRSWLSSSYAPAASLGFATLIAGWHSGILGGEQSSCLESWVPQGGLAQPDCRACFVRFGCSLRFPVQLIHTPCQAWEG